MNIFISLTISAISIISGFFLAYFFIKRKSSKAFEPAYVKAQLELQNGNYELAVKYFNSVIKDLEFDNPFYTSSLVGIAQAYSKINESQLAGDYIAKAQSLPNNKSNALLQSQLSKLLSKIEKSEI